MKRSKNATLSAILWRGGIISISIFGISISTLTSCSHDGDISQLETISYSKSIAPIISGNCSTTGCHDGREESSFNTYNELMSIVKAGDSRGSKLYKVITSSWDFSRMPQSPRDPLTKQQRTLIDVWILQGAKNN